MQAKQQIIELNSIIALKDSDQLAKDSKIKELADFNCSIKAEYNKLHRQFMEVRS